MSLSCKHFILVLPLMLVAGLALEKPSSANSEGGEKSSLNVPQTPLERRVFEQKEVPLLPQKEPAEKSAWLGVHGKPIDSVIAHHLGETSGVILQVVSEGSPADQAGLTVNDLILEVDGKPIASQLDLKEVVQSFKPEEKLKVTALCKGEKKQLEVILTERPLTLNQVENNPKQRRKGFFDFINPSASGGERRSNFGQLMDGFGGIQKLMQEVDSEKNWGVDFQSSGTVMIMDQEGSVELKMFNEGKHVVVKNPTGEVIFEGPWETEADKEKASPKVREKINKLNFDKSGIKMSFGFGR